MFNDASVSGSVAGCVRDTQCPGSTICCPDGSCALTLELCNGKKYFRCLVVAEVKVVVALVVVVSVVVAVSLVVVVVLIVVRTRGHSANLRCPPKKLGMIVS